jgi:branched-chain amino acid transport system ATP-binding protein
VEETTNAAPASAALNVVDLTSGYADKTVLRKVSLTVGAGTVTALLGPNGAGKSTLLRTVAGFIRPTNGTIEFGGQPMTSVPPDRRAAAGLCYIPEGRGIYRGLTVRENILVQSANLRAETALGRAIEAFPVLGRKLDQRAGTMSGGEQQMLALAAAHVRQPTMILVDEASLGLAPLVVDEIFEFLERRAHAGVAILMVDQFAARALEMATLAYVLRKGEIAFSGLASEVVADDLFGYYIGSESNHDPKVLP